MKGKYIKPRRPTPEQQMLIAKAGLNPLEWSVRYENDKYLSLVERGFERRRIVRIDLDSLEIQTR